jgi:hypothetical protein
VLVEPLDVEGQRAAIHDALSWSPQDYAQRRHRLLDATMRNQTWASFDARVHRAIDDLLATSSAR